MVEQLVHEGILEPTQPLGGHAVPEVAGIMGAAVGRIEDHRDGRRRRRHELEYPWNMLCPDRRLWSNRRAALQRGGRAHPSLR